MKRVRINSIQRSDIGYNATTLGYITHEQSKATPRLPRSLLKIFITDLLCGFPIFASLLKISTESQCHEKARMARVATILIHSRWSSIIAGAPWPLRM